MPFDVTLPLSVIPGTPALTLRLRPTVVVPSVKPLISTMVTSFAPAFVSVTAPVKSLVALLSVIALVPALMLLVPVTLSVVVAV